MDTWTTAWRRDETMTNENIIFRLSVCLFSLTSSASFSPLPRRRLDATRVLFTALASRTSLNMYGELHDPTRWDPSQTNRDERRLLARPPPRVFPIVGFPRRLPLRRVFEHDAKREQKTRQQQCDRRRLRSKKTTPYCFINGVECVNYHCCWRPV